MHDSLAIDFNEVEYSYLPGLKPLSQISFGIKKGERVCLLGRNGSGKSTLLRLAAGLLQPQHGEISIDGISTGDVRMIKQIRSKVGFIFQNPEDQIISTTVESDVAFALENLAVPTEEMKGRVSSVLERFAISHLTKRHPMTLSAGEKQRLALASMMVVKPEILLLDEPTSFLDARGKRLLFDTVFDDHMKTILAATQYPGEVDKYERVIFLDSHGIVFDGPSGGFKNTSFWSDMNTGESRKAWNPEEANHSETGALTHAPKSNDNRAAIIVRELSFEFESNRSVFQGLNLEIPRNKITAITGDSGCGKTTLALLLTGLIKPNRGVILVGQDLSDPDAQSTGQVAVIFQFPESSFFAETVFEEVAFGVKDLKLSRDELKQRVADSLRLVGLSHEEFASRNPFTLSAGEQRRVAIAAVLIMDRLIVIFDETAIGLDWEGRRAIGELLQNLKRSGKTIILMTHDLDFVERHADLLIRIGENHS